MDTKGIIFDFNFFKTLTDASFTSHLQSKIDTFVNYLIEGKKTGICLHLYLLYCNNIFEILIFNSVLDNLQATSLFDVKTFQIATISTTDPNININILLEVTFFTIYYK